MKPVSERQGLNDTASQGLFAELPFVGFVRDPPSSPLNHQFHAICAPPALFRLPRSSRGLRMLAGPIYTHLPSSLPLGAEFVMCALAACFMSLFRVVVEFWRLAGDV